VDVGVIVGGGGDCFVKDGVGGWGWGCVGSRLVMVVRVCVVHRLYAKTFCLTFQLLDLCFD